MSNSTLRFGLPFIIPGQAQKELFHNEALTRIDMALHPAVETGPLSAPPPAPEEGMVWIVADSATGEWAGQDHKIGMWSDGGWRFIEPQPGMTAWNKEAGHWVHWSGTGWSEGEVPATALVIDGAQVVGPRLPSILTPSGGTIIDAEARSAVGAIIATLMSHGLIG